MLRFEGVGLVAGGARLLDRIDLALAPGERVAVLGAGGAGKSLLARLAVGLQQPGSGLVRLFGEDLNSQSPETVRQLRARVGVVLQGGSLLGALSVEDNLRLGLGPQRAAYASRFARRIDQLLLQFGIEQLGSRPVSRLSTGERRQVELARAALRDPDLLILDEPFEGAAGIAPRLEREIARRTAGRGCALLLLTQDMELAARLASRVLVLEAGRLRAQQAPAERVPAA